MGARRAAASSIIASETGIDVDASVVSALSAVVGSIVGLSASVATTWVAQRTIARRQALDAQMKKHEALYGEFISECSRLAIDALDHSLESPEKILKIYELENRIRLCASEPVVAATARAIQWIGEQYMKDNLAPGELRQLVLTAFHEPENRKDPLKPFSEACRRELGGLARAA